MGGLPVDSRFLVRAVLLISGVTISSLLAMLNSMFSSFRSTRDTEAAGEKRGRFRENPKVPLTDVLQTPPNKRSKQTNSDKRQEGELSPFAAIGGLFKQAMSWAEKYDAWKYVVGGKKERDKTTKLTLNDDKNVSKHLSRKHPKREPEVVVIDDMPLQEDVVVLAKEVIVLDSPESKKPLHEVLSRREPPRAFALQSSTPLRPPDEFTRGHKPILSLTTQDIPRTGNPHGIVRHDKQNQSSIPFYHKATHFEKPTLNTESSNSSFTVGRSTPTSGKVRIRKFKEALRKPISRQHKSTAREVVRLDEKQRYMQLLSQFTTSPLAHDSTIKDKENHSIILHDLKEEVALNKPHYSQRKVVRQSNQAVLSPRSSLLPSNLSPDREPSILKVKPSLDRTHIPNKHVEDLPVYSKTESFKSQNSSIIVPPTSRSPNQDCLIDEEWTRKWKDILSEDNLSRERENARIQREEKRLQELKAKRREERLAAVEELKARIYHEEEEESEEEEDAEQFPVLTDEMERKIDCALGPGNPSETLADGGKVSVTRGDMVTLSNLNWLNDEVINFYISLITERSKLSGYPKVHSFNSFFYPKLIKTGYDSLKRWTRRVDIFQFDLIVVPIHLGMHWCLAVIDFRNKTIQYYDSLKGSNPQCLEALKKYLSQESMDKKKTPYDTSDWTLSCPKDIPEQLNGCDCGVFACKYAEYISRDAKFTFDQRNMPYFRRRMVYEILNMKLL